MISKGNWLIKIICLSGLLGGGLLGCLRSEERPSAQSINVAGEYKTAVTLTDDNTCGPVEVQSLPTTITHELGSTDLIFTHAGNSYAGVLQADGNFATDPTPLVFTQSTYTITVQGQFSPTGFDAQTTVEVKQTKAPQNCRYVVHMVGSKE